MGQDRTYTSQAFGLASMLHGADLYSQPEPWDFASRLTGMKRGLELHNPRPRTKALAKKRAKAKAGRKAAHKGRHA